MAPSVPDGEYELDLSFLLSRSAHQGLQLAFPGVSNLGNDRSVKLNVVNDDVSVFGEGEVYEGKLESETGPNNMVSVFDPVKKRFLLQRLQDVNMKNGPSYKSNDFQSDFNKVKGNTQWVTELIDRVKGNAINGGNSMSPTPRRKSLKDGNEDLSKAINTLSAAKKRRTDIGSSAMNSPLMSPSMNAPSRPQSVSLRNISPSRTISPVRLSSPLSVKRHNSEISDISDDRVCKSPVIENAANGKGKSAVVNKSSTASTSTSIKKSTSLLQKARRVHSRNQAHMKSTSKLEVSSPIKETSQDIKRAFLKLEKNAASQQQQSVNHKPQGLGVKKPIATSVMYHNISMTPPIESSSDFEEIKPKDKLKMESNPHAVKPSVVTDLSNDIKISPSVVTTISVVKPSSDDIEFDMDDIDWGDADTVETSTSGIGNIIIEEGNPNVKLKTTMPAPVAVPIPKVKSSATISRSVVGDESCDSIDQLVDELAEFEEKQQLASDMSEEE